VSGTFSGLGLLVVLLGFWLVGVDSDCSSWLVLSLVFGAGEVIMSVCCGFT